MTATWPDVVADLKRQVAAWDGVFEALDEPGRLGLPPLPAWAPPAGLGPVPARLEPELRDLMAAMTAIEDEATRRLAGLVEALASGSRYQMARPTPPPVFFDTSA